MDTETLVDQVTRIIMQRLGTTGSDCPGAPSVVTFGDVPACVLADDVSPRRGSGPADADGADYIVLSQAAFKAFHGGTIPAGLVRLPVSNAAPSPSPSTGCAECGGASTFDLGNKRLIDEADVKHLDIQAGSTVRVCGKAIVTSLARDFVTGHGGQIVR